MSVLKVLSITAAIVWVPVTGFIVTTPGMFHRETTAEMRARYAREVPLIASVISDDEEENKCLARYVNGIRAAHPEGYAWRTQQMCQMKLP